MKIVEVVLQNLPGAFPEIPNSVWSACPAIEVTRDWQGQLVDPSRTMTVRLLGGQDSLLIRYDAQQHEPLVVSEHPSLNTKTIGLWDRDVVEVFLAPDLNQPEHYYEFEVAPTGEWVDLEITQLPDGRITNQDYHSGMQVTAQIDHNSVMMVMAIPWLALGGRPNSGQNWRGNFFRCIGSGDDRGYLAWSPTHTHEPNFHVPEVFGEIRFV